jgi:hypothetical protein
VQRQRLGFATGLTLRVYVHHCMYMHHYM